MKMQRSTKNRKESLSPAPMGHPCGIYCTDCSTKMDKGSICTDDVLFIST